MSCILLKQSGNVPPLFRLPDEILEEIVSELDQHRDLVAFALASRICATMVIPHHTQYRILRVRHTFPDMWAHLARRSDLARNIREVHICERSNTWAPDRYPVTLIDKTLDGALENAEESVRIRNICLALSHMHLLHTFTWSWENVRGQAWPTSNPGHEKSILTVISQRPQLRHVALHGKFAMFILGSQRDPESKTYPVWSLANLKSLSLRGEAWASSKNSLHLRHLLANCPDLESLEVPMEFNHLAECRLPNLKKVKLEMQAGVVDIGIDRSRSLFLENHPTIEELFWSPIGAPFIAQDALPNLKSLCTNQRFIAALEDADSGAHSIGLMTPPSTPLTTVIPISDEPIHAPPPIVRHIENLDIYGVARVALLHSKILHPDSLRRLRINSLEDPATLQEIAQTFPNIEWLSLCHPQYYNPDVYDRDAWLDVLPRFRKLEVFRGLGLWRASYNDRQKMHECILDLVEACPRLRVLDRINKYNEADEHNQIVITRNGDLVDYRYQKKPSRNPFDIMNGLFD
ncbi:hypothetical protein BDN70DRAFT_408241 [Pholiota conissans]|uniref:F-box domain-containing protein n=1 Tax=Pholiota conissans TaxID=109636 RepID=A0A9P5Z9C2_9AGAR|nr:hypothetical protein BDN70DRAFT_408241 [Pholiota conissans]